MSKIHWLIVVFLFAAIAIVVCVRQLIHNRIKKAEESTRYIEEKAKEEFLTCAVAFSGYYQPLYDAISSEDANISQRMLDIWGKRMEEMTYVKLLFSAICRQTDDICKNGEKWLDTIHSWGIKQDKLGEFVISSSHQILYLFDDVYEIEDIAEVIKPAWFYINEDRIKCIEQGIARVKEK